MDHGAAFDVQAVCSGFVYALAMADNMLRLGQAETAVVVGAEVFSRILERQDRGTCVLLGDGAGALVLRAEDKPDTGSDSGVQSMPLIWYVTFYPHHYVEIGDGKKVGWGKD